MQDFKENQNPSVSFDSESHMRPRYSVEYRTLMWKQQAEERIKGVREANKNKDLDGCTFHPVLIPAPVNLDRVELNKCTKRSYEKYIKRMRGVREVNERKYQEEMMKPGSGICSLVTKGNVWKKKVTIPKAPAFSRENKASRELAKFQQLNQYSYNEGKASDLSNPLKPMTSVRVSSHRQNAAGRRTNRIVNKDIEFQAAIELLHKSLMDIY